ncbi:gamma-glutamyl-gamma-aminobutyraldehyde dehydrogenase [Arboricoccus pini]|uniref:Gamma-glutamyl-gamma-aminobutyraldehyde dehydrogenase n=1 Tax=Arboricoccus pini TaxID=1963835 RepID=A0A212RMP7_9PROT|nr:aldehyde dehydrogenase family protein [Arboricoccus pini]SNB73838.1 gamma-glutamyl-gamma-aminobutyraldehyde dehydrogenase [Arboricoccus pini]
MSEALATRSTAAWHSAADGLAVEIVNVIDGRHGGALSGQTFDVVSPVSGAVRAKAPRSTAEDVDVAVKSARKAFRGGAWSRLAPRERMAVLSTFADLIAANTERFALLDTLDMGKPVMDMVNVDVPGSATCMRFFAETIDKIEGAVTSTAFDAFHYILRQPLGVVGLIVPWNYPLMMAVWKLAPALACGNSVVLKPAEQSPSSAVLLADLFIEAGGPEGVFNVVQGLGHEAGAALALHMDVDKIGFTGSVEIGKKMMIYAGQSNMKRVTTECGGKTPQIILPDVADLDRAVTYAVNGIFANQGEVCNAGSRLLVDRSVHDRFLDRFLTVAAESYQPGDPLSPETTMGPLVTSEQQKRVLGFIEKGKAEGASLKLGGGVPAGLEKGAFVSPTVFADVTNQMTIAKEEIFGPVASILPVDGLAEALTIANDTSFGLAASIWTSDVKKALTFARDVEAGVVWVNCFDHGDMTQPWGGFKQSGNGRDKCLEALTHYTQTKSVWVDLA